MTRTWGHWGPNTHMGPFGATHAHGVIWGHLGPNTHMGPYGPSAHMGPFGAKHAHGTIWGQTHTWGHLGTNTHMGTFVAKHSHGAIWGQTRENELLFQYFSGPLIKLYNLYVRLGILIVKFQYFPSFPGYVRSLLVNCGDLLAGISRTRRQKERIRLMMLTVMPTASVMRSLKSSLVGLVSYLVGLVSSLVSLVSSW